MARWGRGMASVWRADGAAGRGMMATMSGAWAARLTSASAEAEITAVLARMSGPRIFEYVSRTASLAFAGISRSDVIFEYAGLELTATAGISTAKALLSSRRSSGSWGLPLITRSASSEASEPVISKETESLNANSLERIPGRMWSAMIRSAAILIRLLEVSWPSGPNIFSAEEYQ